jgi:hypothetical protein
MENPLSKDGAYWCGRAENARVSSEIMTDTKSRRMMEDVAKSCDALAQSAEREEAANSRGVRRGG